MNVDIEVLPTGSLGIAVDGDVGGGVQTVIDGASIIGLLPVVGTQDIWSYMALTGVLDPGDHAVIVKDASGATITDGTVTVTVPPVTDRMAVVRQRLYEILLSKVLDGTLPADVCGNFQRPLTVGEDYVSLPSPMIELQPAFSQGYRFDAASSILLNQMTLPMAVYTPADNLEDATAANAILELAVATLLSSNWALASFGVNRYEAQFQGTGYKFVGTEHRMICSTGELILILRKKV